MLDVIVVVVGIWCMSYRKSQAGNHVLKFLTLMLLCTNFRSGEGELFWLIHIYVTLLKLISVNLQQNLGTHSKGVNHKDI